MDKISADEGSDGMGNVEAMYMWCARNETERKQTVRLMRVGVVG